MIRFHIPSRLGGWLAVALLLSLTGVSRAQPDPRLAAIPDRVINATPTYDGSGQAVHPCIRYFPSSLHGHHFYLAMTPYPWGDAAFENPSILVSDNGYEWAEPEGGVNPIVPAPEVGYNDDPDLFWNDTTHELYLYYLETAPDTNFQAVNLLRSSDGIDWDRSTLITYDLEVDPFIVSPAVIKAGSLYYMFYVDISAAPRRIEYLTSPDGLAWDKSQAHVIDASWPAGVEPWHMSILAGPDDRYYMLCNRWSEGLDLYLGISRDLEHWDLLPEPILTDGEHVLDGESQTLDIIHRSTGLIDASADLLIVWFGFRRIEGDWGIADVKLRLSDLAPTRTLHVPDDYGTIQSAIDAAVYGDTVLVATGTYWESVRFNGKDITVLAADMEDPPTIRNFSTRDLVVFADHETNAAVLEGFKLVRGRVAVWCQDSAPTIRRNLMRSQRTSDRAAVALSGSAFGIAGSSPAMLINNTISGSAHGGVFCNSTAAPTIKNNIVVDCDYGIRNEGGAAVPPDLSYNDVWACADLYQSCPDIGPGAISADPRFTGDYRLAADSPCRDAGDPDPLFNDPDWTRNDMGWRYFPAPIGVDDERGVVVGLDSPGMRLAAYSYPNPFNPTTSIRFHLDSAAHVDLAVYDARGERVRTLADGGFASGRHRIRWDGTDGKGGAVASGVYFFRLRAGSAVGCGRMTLVK